MRPGDAGEPMGEAKRGGEDEGRAGGWRTCRNGWDDGQGCISYDARRALMALRGFRKSGHRFFGRKPATLQRQCGPAQVRRGSIVPGPGGRDNRRPGVIVLRGIAGCELSRAGLAAGGRFRACRHARVRGPIRRDRAAGGFPFGTERSNGPCRSRVLAHRAGARPARPRLPWPPPPLPVPSGPSPPRRRPSPPPHSNAARAHCRTPGSGSCVPRRVRP